VPAQHTSIILTHENADFDAISAQMAAAKLYPEAIPVLPRRVNRNVRHFLTLYGAELPLTSVQDLLAIKPKGAPPIEIDRVILVDTQSMVTLKGMSRDLEVQIIDHHPLSRDLPAGWAYGGETLGAVTTLLVEQIIEAREDISPIEATLFLLGIYEDTGSLSYHATTPRDVRCAAWLLEQGAKLDIADDFLHYPLTADQRELYERLVEQHKSYSLAGHSIIVASTPFPRYVDEVSVLAHKLRDLWEPAGLFLLVGFDDQVQLIARSTSDAIDVGLIASGMGGGGHSRAAAALIREQGLPETEARLLKLLERTVQPAVTVRQIMSYGVRTFAPQTTVTQAADLMVRYGHEGFPVLEGGQVVGMLARREIDRAMNLGLGNAAISMLMTKGQIEVHPDDSIETLQQVMTEYAVGQVPVVSAEGEIIGIVTRTDLIRLLLDPDEGAGPSRQDEISLMLDHMIPRSKLALLEQAAQAAESLDYALYIVGGFVRDLLLGRPNYDIDLVVEGDAIVLARRLAAEGGGRVRSHDRFRTAKWILDGGESLDFVTARTEFYLHPTALPQVESSSIKQDLHRRDFTINTLAIRLDGEHYGELLDFYGGEQDLQGGVIRVLHSLSFIEDTTRVLRAIRLEQRLGFHIEPRTQELIGNALGFLGRVSGKRIRHELFLLFQEPEPEAGLARMQELGVLRHIHPGLRCDGWLQRKYETLRYALPQWYESSWLPALAEEDHDALHGMSTPTDNAPHLYLALLAYRLVPAELETLIERLKIARDDADLLHEVVALHQRVETLQVQDVRPSEVYRLLEPYSGPAILITWVATDSPGVRGHLSRYWHDYRHVKPTADGNDLKALGISPGPIYGQILDVLRDACLDGQIASPAEERALLHRLVDDLV
jgi:tRNA nucleotidyltransferase (CCA-adding enzyme)